MARYLPVPGTGGRGAAAGRSPPVKPAPLPTYLAAAARAGAARDRRGSGGSHGSLLQSRWKPSRPGKPMMARNQWELPTGDGASQDVTDASRDSANTAQTRQKTSQDDVSTLVTLQDVTRAGHVTSLQSVTYTQTRYGL